MPAPTPERAEHGPEVCCYSLSGTYHRHVPFIACLCGWSAEDTCWEDLGRAFDEHLEDHDA